MSVCRAETWSLKAASTERGKYVKGCLQAKNNNAVCVCSNIISLVKSAALEESSMALRAHRLCFPAGLILLLLLFSLF